MWGAPSCRGLFFLLHKSLRWAAVFCFFSPKKRNEGEKDRQNLSKMVFWNKPPVGVFFGWRRWNMSRVFLGCLIFSSLFSLKKPLERGKKMKWSALTPPGGWRHIWVISWWIVAAKARKPENQKLTGAPDFIQQETTEKEKTPSGIQGKWASKSLRFFFFGTRKPLRPKRAAAPGHLRSKGILPGWWEKNTRGWAGGTGGCLMLS